VSAFRVAWAPDAEAARAAMDTAARAALDAGMRRIAADPYGHGSTAIRGDKDRREATIGAAVVLYYVSTSVLTVTVVYVIH
jgi:hypothetical protein